MDTMKMINEFISKFGYKFKYSEIYPSSKDDMYELRVWIEDGSGLESKYRTIFVRNQDNPKEYALKMLINQLIESYFLTIKNDEKIINKILKFSADWCGPCQVLKKTLSNFNEYPIEEINVDEDDELCSKYNITNIPVLVFIDKNEKELGRLNGAVNLDEINKKINEINNQ